MWNDYIKTINSIKKDNLEDYAYYYSEAFSIHLYSFEETELILNNSSIDLFPQRKVLEDCLNTGNNIKLLLSIFYFWKTLNLNWLFIEVNNVSIDIAFDDKSKFFIYDFIGFYPELLLSNDDKDRTLSFLFLFFLPHTYPYSLLYHYSKKVPLLTFHQISENHFNMLIYLMRKYDSISFDNYCSDYNFNHLLIENFMDNAKELFNFQNNIIWKNILPINKIIKLLEFGCNFNLFYEYRQRKNFYTFEDLPDVLIKIQKEYLYNQLLHKVPSINIHRKEINKI